MQSMGYRQLTQTQRYQIHARYDVGMSQRQISREMSLHRSTISRELRRNAISAGYNPEQAQMLGKIIMAVLAFQNLAHFLVCEEK